MAALEQYYFKPNTLQTPRVTAGKIVKWKTAWKDAKSVAGFSPSCLFRVRWNDITLTRLSCQVQFQNGSLQSRFFRDEFFSIAGTSEAEPLVSEKAECFLTIGKGKI